MSLLTRLDQSAPITLAADIACDQPNLFAGKAFEQSLEAATTVIEWLGQPLLAPYHPAIAAVGDTVSWMVLEAAVVLVRGRQSDRETTAVARVVERLAWRGHATVRARVADRHDATPVVGHWRLGGAAARHRPRRQYSAAVAEIRSAPHSCGGGERRDSRRSWRCFAMTPPGPPQPYGAVTARAPVSDAERTPLNRGTPRAG